MLPDPKEIVDSVADGACELATAVPRFVRKEADVVSRACSDVERTLVDIRFRTPNDLSVLPDAAIKCAGSAVKAMVGAVKAGLEAADETARGVQNQISRVVK